jgi:hypothetical protein
VNRGPVGDAGGPLNAFGKVEVMSRLLALAVLVLGLISCQPEFVLPGGSPEPELPTASPTKPTGPSPSIEIPPPI